MGIAQTIAHLWEEEVSKREREREKRDQRRRELPLQTSIWTFYVFLVHAFGGEAFIFNLRVNPDA